MDELLNCILKKYSNINKIEAWGETSLFYNPGKLKRGIYFCTFKIKDGPNDKDSNLNRKNTFRFNFQISKENFIKFFKKIPKRSQKNTGFNYEVIDQLTPHPVYAWMQWVSIINPSILSIKKFEYLIHEAYLKCMDKYNEKNL